MSRLRWLLFWSRQHDDLTREMDAHIAERIDALVDDGVFEADARAQAHREFGNVTLLNERSREVWIAAWLTGVWQDLRYAVRSLWRQPGFTLSAVGILSVGIGLVVALVTVVNAEFLRPWPVNDADRCAVLIARPAPGQQYGHISTPEFRYLREQSRTFQHLSAWLRGGADVELGGATASVQTNFVTSNYFAMLGVPAGQGRAFLESEEDYVQPRPVATISHRLWQNVFGAPSTIVGSGIRVRGVTFTVVGVMPAGFTDVQDGYHTDVWMPLPSEALLYPEMPWPFDDAAVGRFSGIAGRLADDVRRDAAAAELGGLSRQFRTGIAQAYGGIDLVGTRRIDKDADGFRRQLASMGAAFSALLLVLLLCCANVGNLVLARGLHRRRETAVRLAVGASRGRVIRGLVVETLVVASFATAIAIGVASVGLRTFVSMQSSIQNADLLKPDLFVGAMALLLAVLATAIAGLLPAARLTRTNIAGVASRRHGGSAGAGRLRTGLLAVQLGASMVLLVTAGLLTRAAGAGLSLDTGFDIDRVQVISFGLADATADRRSAFERALAQALQTGSTSSHAFSQFTAITDSGIMGPVRVLDGDTTRTVLYRPVSSGYFSVTGIPLVAGRAPAARDDSSEVVINQSAARSLWPDSDALGRQLAWSRGENEQRYVVVGVARDVPVRSLTTTEPVLYAPWHRGGLLLLRDPSPAAVDLVRTMARGLEPGVTVDARPLGDDIRAAMSQVRFGSYFAWTLGGLALTLATVGAFGVFAYMVEERRREIGVRMALGATSASVVRTVVGGARWPILFGLGGGLILSMLAAQLLRGTLYGLSPFDPITYIGIASLLTVAALIATWIPARRATRIDPAVTLRGD